MGSLSNWLHLVHVLSAMVWVGGGVTLSVMGLRARSSTEPGSVAAFARVLPYVGIRILMPSVVLVLITGILLVASDSEFHFSQAWVLLAFGLFALAFAIGGIYLSRVGIQLDRLGAAGPQAGTTAVALVNRWLVGYAIVLLVLLIAVWDMVFKPGT